MFYRKIEESLGVPAYLPKSCFEIPQVETAFRSEIVELRESI